MLAAFAPVLVFLVWLPGALYVTRHIIRRRTAEAEGSFATPVVYARLPSRRIHVAQTLPLHTAPAVGEDHATECAATHVGLVIDPLLRPSFGGVVVPVQGFEQDPCTAGRIEHDARPGYWTLCLN